MPSSEFDAFYALINLVPWGGQAEGHPPKDVHILILEYCERVTFHSKRDLADVIKLMILRKTDYPGLFGLTQWNHMGP